MKSIFLVWLLYLILFFDYSQGSKDDLDQIRELVREVDATIDQYEKSYFNDIDLNKDSINDNNSLVLLQMEQLGYGKSYRRKNAEQKISC